MRVKKMNNSLKLVYLVIGVVCLMLGVVGLIIPVIPGILFLAVALFLLSRVSRKFSRLMQSDPRLREMHERMERMGDIGVMDRVRLGGWMIADATLKGLAGFFGLVRRVIPRNEQRRPAVEYNPRA
jgi:uncharacterized membrane protein YbaN (DUF454 family)